MGTFNILTIKCSWLPEVLLRNRKKSDTEFAAEKLLCHICCKLVRVCVCVSVSVFDEALKHQYINIALFAIRFYVSGVFIFNVR